ncbi:MAG TPA: hypothetical protein IAC36_05190 [Candidatus Aphodomonas merdavium]|nr:hypothetical protein [Candidatus Aphodomonas merdavium]
MDDKEFRLKEGEAEQQGPRNWKEEQYEKLRGKISVRTLDKIIIGLVVLFFAVVILGVIRARMG